MSNCAFRLPPSAFRWVLCTLAVFLCGSDWPGFRGRDGRGVSDETNLPLEFGDDENVAWKVPLPGSGPSSPIVVGGRVVVTAASGPRQDVLHLLAFEAADGELAWHRQFWATGSSLYNEAGGVAANTPASDGQSLFAFFSSGDLACFDLEGNLRWMRGLGSDYPAARNDVGMASSPLVVGRTVVVQMESESDAFAAGLDTTTGLTRWRLPREKGASWCSPAVLRGLTPEEDLVLVQSRNRLTAHEPDTGRQRWQFETECHTIASLTTWAGTVYLPANGLNALKLWPQGGVELAWYAPVLSSGYPSPTVCGGRSYTIKSAGVLACGDVRDGSVLWQLRLKGSFWASPVIADGHLIAVNRDGLAQVVRLEDDHGELVAERQLEPGIRASPAVADGAIYFRSDEHLWKIAYAVSER